MKSNKGLISLYYFIIIIIKEIKIIITIMYLSLQIKIQIRDIVPVCSLTILISLTNSVWSITLESRFFGQWPLETTIHRCRLSRFIVQSSEEILLSNWINCIVYETPLCNFKLTMINTHNLIKMTIKEIFGMCF